MNFYYTTTLCSLLSIVTLTTTASNMQFRLGNSFSKNQRRNDWWSLLHLRWRLILFDKWFVIIINNTVWNWIVHNPCLWLLLYTRIKLIFGIFLAQLYNFIFNNIVFECSNIFQKIKRLFLLNLRFLYLFIIFIWSIILVLDTLCELLTIWLT